MNDPLFSIVVYTTTALVLAWLGGKVSRREAVSLRSGGGELSVFSWEIVALALVYITVSSLRWLTSWDYNMYYGYFVSIQSLGDYSRENFEPLFALITYALSHVGAHFSVYFAFWAITQVVLLLYAMRHRKALLPWLALCVFLGPYYIFWMGFIRQSIVEALFVLMVELIVRRKFWIYLLVTVVAMGIHRMCILFIPLYFVPLIPMPTRRRWLPIALLALCVLLGSFPHWLRVLFDHFGRFADLLGYGHYYRLFMSNDLEYAFRSVMGPARLCPLISCLMIVWYYPAMRDKFSQDACFPAMFRFAVLYMCYINLFANTTQYLTRPGELMRTVFLVMVCYTFHYLWQQRKWLPFIALCFLNFYYVFYEMVKAQISPSSIYVPAMYHTFLSF